MMQRYSPTVHHYTSRYGSTDLVRGAMKEDSETGDWYHRTDVAELKKYVEHKRACDAWPYKLAIDGYAPTECTCGLSKVLSLGEK